MGFVLYFFGRFLGYGIWDSLRDRFVLVHFASKKVLEFGDILYWGPKFPLTLVHIKFSPKSRILPYFVALQLLFTLWLIWYN